MAKLYTITETILSTGTADVEAVIASSLQTWTYANEEHSQLALTSLKDELLVAYPKGNDGEFRITHEQHEQLFTITILKNQFVYETITLAYHVHTDTSMGPWWQTLSQLHQEAIAQQFAPTASHTTVVKSLISGFSPKDDDGLATSLQTWTYHQPADAEADFGLLATELKTDYPLGVHEEGFEVTRAEQTATTACVEVTLDGEDYEKITLTHMALLPTDPQPWWQNHSQAFHEKCLPSK